MVGNLAYTFDDIALIPQYSELTSRLDADTSVALDTHFLRAPVISANMEKVTGPNMAVAMYKAGGIGALHRFCDIKQSVIDYEIVRHKDADTFVSVGIKKEDQKRTVALYDAGARMFIIDIAHGHCVMMMNMLKWMRDKYGKNIYIVAGNVATSEATQDLVKWGADVVKVGVGGGSVCTTRVVTGHGVPTFTAILKCSHMAHAMGAKVIADGGIRSSGDIVKSFVAGADYVMLGSLLSGTDETPGEVYQNDDGSTYKVYRGSASYDKKGTTKEGIITQVPTKGSVCTVIESLMGGLRSGMSYCNAANLKEISQKAKWVTQSSNGVVEGRPHIR